MRRALPLAAAVLLTGCIATQRDVIGLENQADELKFQVLELKKTISSMQSNQADMIVEMKQLHGDLGVFTESVKDLQGSMDKLATKIDDVNSGVANVGSGISTKVNALGQSLRDEVEQQKKEVEQQKKDVANVERKISQTSNIPSPTELYMTAEVRLAKKDYELAARGFEEYVERFPNGALIDVALYNLGEAYYGQGKWEAAGRQFAAALERFPKSKMTPSTRLLYALCLINLKRNIAEAKQYLESIPADFPKSPEAKAAEEHLRKISRERPQRKSRS